MKAAVVYDFNAAPRHGEFPEPSPFENELPIAVAAAALSPLVRGRASGRHYSGGATLPFVPGVDGVGRREDGRRVYFLGSRPPFGAMAERMVARHEDVIDLPDEVDDATAAAIANPGMSSSAALVYRAKLQPGEAVLVHGATGVAGGLALKIAKHLGAGRVVATGRGPKFVETAKAMGADVAISLDQADDLLSVEFAQAISAGVDVVLDYLWGPPAERLLHAFVGSGSPEGEPRVRYVQIGSVAGPSIALPSEFLRSTGLELIGSGLGSVSRADLLDSIDRVFKAVVPAGLQVATEVVPLSEVEEAWNRETKGRIVFTL